MTVLKLYSFENVEETFQTKNGQIRAIRKDYITVENFLDLLSLHDKLKVTTKSLYGLLIREYEGRIVLEIYDEARE